MRMQAMTAAQIFIMHKWNQTHRCSISLSISGFARAISVSAMFWFSLVDGTLVASFLAPS